jgi:hypothetical protein
VVIGRPGVPRSQLLVELMEIQYQSCASRDRLASKTVGHSSQPEICKVRADWEGQYTRLAQKRRPESGGDWKKNSECFVPFRGKEGKVSSEIDDLFPIERDRTSRELTRHCSYYNVHV